MPVSETPGSSPPVYDSNKDPYRGVVLVLLALALLGMAGAVVAGFWLPNGMLVDVGVTLGLSAAVLIGVAYAQLLRARAPKSDEEGSVLLPEDEVPAETPPDASAPAQPIYRRLQIPEGVERWFQDLGEIGRIRIGIGIVVVIAIASVTLLGPPAVTLAPFAAIIAAIGCLIAAGLAATAARYLTGIEPDRFPEGPGLCRGARVVAWILVLAAVSMGLTWAGKHLLAQVLQVTVLLIDVLVCYDLMLVKEQEQRTQVIFSLDLAALKVLGSRPNILAGVLDSAEEQLGIDLRSTWALTVVRRSVEPLIIGLCLVGWISTSLTVVGVEEQGLVERLGVPVGGQPLPPGLHLHWPWPVDQVFRIPVQRVNAVQVGHEGEESGGPEDVVWAVEHAPNEYTLLLGNGRDLITVDAAVQYRIVDARAWRYHCQNPGDALRAIAYRAVMRSTVNHTLSEALSENIVTLTGGIRSMIQQEADALGLGVEIIGFTIGGMHPPVPVAGAYEAVISAQIRKVTAVVNAQVYRNRTVPSAESIVVMADNNARSEGAAALGKAAGEAWSFRALEAQYRVAPEEYFFRRRLETMEAGLAGRRFIIVDSRFQRDGGELWLTQ